jgi:hypothetical protein
MNLDERALALDAAYDRLPTSSPIDDELDRYVGKWVAVKDGEIVAVHDSGSALRADPASKAAWCFRVKPRHRRYLLTL